MAYTPTATYHNPLGLVPGYTNEDPCIFTARVLKAVSGGEFVMCSGATTAGNLGSGLSTFTPDDFNICPSIDGYCNGIAVANADSGTKSYVGVARKGCYLVRAGGPCSGGCSVFLSSGGMASAEAVGSVNIIGRSFNATDEGQYGLIALNC